MLSLLTLIFLSSSYIQSQIRVANYLVKDNHKLPSVYVLRQLVVKSPLNCVLRCHANPKCLCITRSHKVICTLYIQDYRNLQENEVEVSLTSKLFFVTMLDCFDANGVSTVRTSDESSDDVCNLESKLDEPKWTDSSEWEYVIEKTCIGTNALAF